MIQACVLYIMLFIGFVAVAWLVGKLPLLKREGEGTELLVDRAVVFLLFASLFGAYTYLMARWLHMEY
jgi:hypothetical protein